MRKNNKYRLLCVLWLSTLVFGLSSCAQSNNEETLFAQTDQQESRSEPGLPSYEALAWEKNNPSRKQWSAYVHALVQKETFSLLDGADDIETFCPRYDQASKEQKINFWGQLIAAVAKFESNWSPVSRYHESTMGMDPVTKAPVYSEGLLQLSYQDTQWEKRCEFNWAIDKNLAPTDPAKSILNSYKNLRCGLLILERQLKSRHRITVNTGVYWAVLKLNGKYQKIDQIAAITKTLSFCQ